MPDFVIRRAGIGDLPGLAPMFNAYRQFYARAPDLPLAAHYLGERLQRDESIVLLAIGEAGDALGFTQLYPTFCSVAAAPICVLYDLWVEPAARRSGVARALMVAAADQARATGAVRLELMTARTNFAAQRLYESLGWVRDQQFFTYSLMLVPQP